MAGPQSQPHQRVVVPVEGADEEAQRQSNAPSQVQVTQILFDGQTWDSLLKAVLDALLTSAGPAAGASVAFRTTSSTELRVGASRDVVSVDRVQHEGIRGPSLDALRSAHRLHVHLRHAGAQWPEFTSAALDAGLPVVLALPLDVGNGPVGSLLLYTRDEGGFSSAEIRAAEDFARDAAVVLANGAALLAAKRAEGQLRANLETRSVICLAQGLLMARHNCGRAQAFDLLRDASQQSNRKLREVAEAIVVEHEQAAPS
jgi:GAF domain-containing protein